jgi:hypothetical protein
MFRRDMHEKRARFSPNVRPNEAVVIHDNDKQLISGISSLHERCGAGDRNYNNGCKRMWVPVRPARPESTNAMVSEHAKGSDADHVVMSGEPKIAKSSSGVQHRQKGGDLVQNKSVSELGLQNGKEGSSSHARNIGTSDGLMHGCTKRTNLHADVKNMEARTEKYVVRPSTSKPVFVSVSQFRESNMKIGAGSKASGGLKIGKYQTAEGIVCSPEVDAVRYGSIQRKYVGIEEQALDYKRVASFSVSQKTESASMHDSVVRSTSLGKRFLPMDFTSSASKFTCWDSRNRGSQKRMFSAKAKIFASRTTVQYRLRNLGGNIIRSIAPGIKPRYQWCPAGLTPTQKRRLQRLRASEIREEIADRYDDVWFNKHRRVVPPKMTWKKKDIVTDKNINADDMVANGISKFSRDAPIDINIDKDG